MSDWKVFIINDTDYIVATSGQQAVQCWSDTTWCCENEAIEVETVRNWKRLKFRYDSIGEKTTTFEKRIKEVLESGEEKIPFFLASSEF